MPLTPETGTGVAGADTYATLAQARAYAEKRGLAFPSDDTAGESALILACDYLETLRWKGEKSAVANALAWPRRYVPLEDGTELASDEIPAVLINAQCQLAIESASGTDLQPTGEGREVIREKIDVLEVQYNPTGSGSVIPKFNKVLAMLAPLLFTGGAFGISVDRA